MPGSAAEARQHEEEGDWQFYTAAGDIVCNAGEDTWSDNDMFEALTRAMDDAELVPIKTMEEWDAFDETFDDTPDPDDFDTAAAYTTAAMQGHMDGRRHDEAQASGRFIELENSEVGFLRLKEDDADVCITDAIEEECDYDGEDSPIEEAHPVLQFLTWARKAHRLTLRAENNPCAPVAADLELLVEFKGYDVRRFRAEQARIKAWEAECADDDDG